MAYIKKIWKDYPDTTTPILASDMNNIENGLETVDTLSTTTANNVNNGWIPLTGTFAYSSADSPTFVMSTSVDLTGIVGLGMRIKLTQTTTKYFIVTAITTSSITMYGGTDYTLTSGAISNAYYSMLKTPYGFPIKYSQEIYSTTEQVVGMWIDGKPLYRKTLSFTDEITKNTLFIKAHGVTNISTIWIDNSATFMKSGSYSCPIPIVGYYGNVTDKLHCYVYGDNICIYSNGGWGTNWVKIITLLYTKTTD